MYDVVDSRPIVVTRPRRLPWGLRKLAEERGEAPFEMVKGVLSRHSTFGAAAAELGVTENALRKWRRALGIQVRETE